MYMDAQFVNAKGVNVTQEAPLHRSHVDQKKNGGSGLSSTSASVCIHDFFLGAACIHDLVSFASKVCTPRPFIQLINKKSFGDMRYGILLRSNINTSTSSKKVRNDTQSKSASQQIVQVFQLTFSPNVTQYYYHLMMSLIFSVSVKRSCMGPFCEG